MAAAYFAEPLRHLHDPAHAAWFKRRKKDREKEPHVLPSKKKTIVPKSNLLPLFGGGAFTLRPSFEIGSDGRHKTRSTFGCRPQEGDPNF